MCFNWQASETLPGINNGNQILVARARCYVMWDELTTSLVTLRQLSVIVTV